MFRKGRVVLTLQGLGGGEERYGEGRLHSSCCGMGTLQRPCCMRGVEALASHTALFLLKTLEYPHFQAAAGSVPSGRQEIEAAAERELERVFRKSNFREMLVAGQFNLGFILARCGADVFSLGSAVSVQYSS